MHLVVRKIGYHGADRFYSLTGHDTLSFEFQLSRVVQTLEPVNVTAQEDLKRRAYHIDAEEIAASPRPILNALDVVTKLRPDMEWGLQGAPQNLVSSVETPGAAENRQRAAQLRGRGDFRAAAHKAGVPHTIRPGDCLPIQQVFVNGVRIVDAPPELVLVADARRGAGLLAPVSTRVLAILMSVKPEHIAEMQYNDCWDSAAQVNRGTSSVFVTLQPGVGYEQGSGSYVSEARYSPFKTQAAPNAFRVGDLPSYRFRVLGVFDDTSGRPIPGAEVTDTLSGLRAATTATGTVSLYFVPDGGSVLRVQKAGYLDATLKVSISPQDTIPITLTLVRR